MKGCGMTPAQYTALNDRLTTLSACLLDYVSADMAWKNRPASTNGQKLKALKKLVSDSENKCFLVYKALKAQFGIESPCTRWDISTLAYLTITVKYRDRTHLSAGWTLGQCSNITLLNKVLRLDSAVKGEADRLAELRQKKSDKTVNEGITASIAEARTALNG